MSDASPYLTTDEAAAIVRMDRDYVSRQCAAGNLKAKKLGTEWRIHRDDLALFMTGAPAPATRHRERRRAS